VSASTRGHDGSKEINTPTTPPHTLRDRMVGHANESSIILENQYVLALIDTGSMISTISESYYDNMENRPELKKIEDFNLDISGANGQEIPYKGYIEAEVRMPHTEIGVLVPLLVVKATNYNREVPAIVGTNLIRELAKLQDYTESGSFAHEWKIAFQAMSQTCVGTVKATKEFVLRPMEVKTITGLVRKSGNTESAVTENLENSGLDKPVICPRVVSLSNPGKTARVPVRICNFTAKVLRIPEKSSLCQLSDVKVLRSVPFTEKDSNEPRDHAEKENIPTDKDPSVHQQSVPEKEKTNNETNNKHTTADINELIKHKYGVDLSSSDMTPDQKHKILKLFEKWQSIFPKTSLDLGHTSAVKHKIELTNDTPFKEPYRKIPPALFNEVKHHLQEMLDIGAIRESSSPFSSNVVIVRKKDGTIRFCVDFRKLNNRTKKDAYGIPRIEDTLHMLSGSRYFSKLDLKSGYWQVEVEESDKEKTAFQVAGLGFYECNRMPFGLCNAPATFQRLMERCMGDLNLRDCLIYLDDIIIYSQDIDTHLDRLDAVFKRLADFNLKVKPSKCEFFMKETTYLGHVVSEDGIKADPKKINSVKNWPTPKSVKEVRQFLGFAGYYRKFIKGFAAIVRPLNDLLIGQPTKKKPNAKTPKKKVKRTPFHWGESQQAAFDTIKNQLINPPVLGYADYTKPFTVHTDASSKGLGAVLYQRQEDKDRVIAYASRSLKQSERNYPAHKLEFLALKWSVTEKFHDYVYGAKFEVVTDNNPLTYVNSTAKLDATGQRWLAALANYDYSIRYRKGICHLDADGLSRCIPREVVRAICQAAMSDDIPLVDRIAVPGSHPPPQDSLVPDNVLVSESLSQKDWIKAQSQDQTISQLVENVRDGTKPSRTTDQKFNTYLREWQHLVLFQGVLYRKTQVYGDERLQLVLPEALRVEVFNALHDDLGHQGRDRTVSLFKERFYFPGMDGYIADMVRKCQRCIRRKSKSTSAELTPIVSTAPMEVVCVDFLSLEKCKGGFENILVLTDHFSRYAQAFPTRNQTARTTAKILFENFVVHYGFPSRIHSDQGPNFESHLIKELCSLAGVEKSRTTPYHPMGNGMVERFNQTLLKMLGTLEEAQKADWKSHVPCLVHAYNATKHESTGYSPYFLMFGRHPRLAIDAFLGLPGDSLTANKQLEYVNKLRHRLRSAYDKAKDASAKASAVNKKRHDLKARQSTFCPGDRVLVKNVSLRGKHKLADRWEPHPYVVIAQPLDDIPVYEVKREGSRYKKSRTLHRNLLLPFMNVADRDDHDDTASYADGCDSSDTEEARDDDSDDDGEMQTDDDENSSRPYVIPMKRRPGERGVLPRSNPGRQCRKQKA